jgi:O-antigen/teichoic acid export membrane protein
MPQGYARSTVVRLLAIGLNAGGSLLLLPFVLKRLGETSFGIWALATSITGYLLLLDFGIALACTNFLSINNNNKATWAKTVSSSMILSLMLMFVLLLGALLVQLMLYLGFVAASHQPLPDVITLLLVEVAFSIPLRLYQSILRAEVRYLEIGLFEIIRIVLRIAGVALILWLGGGLMDIILYGSLINVLFFVLMLGSVYFHDGTTYFHWHNVDWHHLKELFDFSKYTGLGQIAEFFKYRTDNLLVGVLIGISAVAPYAIMIVLVDMMAQIIWRFQSYWETIIMSHAGQNRPAAAFELMLKSLQIGISLALLATFNIWLLGDLFLTLWVGEKYAYLTIPLTLFSLTMIGFAFQFATSPYFNALGKQKINAHLAVIEVVLKLILVVPLTYFYDFNGVIYAGLISTLSASLMRLSVVANMLSSNILLLLKIIIRKFLPILALVTSLSVIAMLLDISHAPPALLYTTVLALQGLALLFWFNYRHRLPMLA